jgi:hypothetical protein
MTVRDWFNYEKRKSSGARGLATTTEPMPKLQAVAHDAV